MRRGRLSRAPVVAPPRAHDRRRTRGQSPHARRPRRAGAARSAPLSGGCDGRSRPVVRFGGPAGSGTAGRPSGPARSGGQSAPGERWGADGTLARRRERMSGARAEVMPRSPVGIVRFDTADGAPGSAMDGPAPRDARAAPPGRLPPGARQRRPPQGAQGALVEVPGVWTPAVAGPAVAVRQPRARRRPGDRRTVTAPDASSVLLVVESGGLHGALGEVPGARCQG